jgi:hypothetical protein
MIEKLLKPAIDVVIEILRGWNAGALTQKRKYALKRMLRDKRFKWRSLDQLAGRVAADEQTTRDLLVEIGARPQENNKVMWGLERRNRR